MYTRGEPDMKPLLIGAILFVLIISLWMYFKYEHATPEQRNPTHTTKVVHDSTPRSVGGVEAPTP